jgi:hypothetical protein
MQHRPT